MPWRPRTVWQRIEQAPVLQIALLFGVQAALVLPDPLAPRGLLFWSSLAMLIAGALLKLVGRLSDDMRREWPLHVESVGNAIAAAGFVLLAAKGASIAADGWEVAQACFGYGALALIFLIRLRLLRRAIRLLHKGP